MRIMAGITDTISEGLGRYSIGEKLRSMRQRKSMGLAELGRHTGLSAGLLSKPERGKLFPTLPTLLRIAMVFGVAGLLFYRRTQAGGGSARSECASLRSPVSRMYRITLRASITALRSGN